MKRFIYNYQIIIRFSNPVTHHFFRLRGLPCANSCQQLLSKSFEIIPADFVDSGSDGWNQLVQCGSYINKHDSFIVLSSGEVIQQRYYIQDSAPCPIFAVPTYYTSLSQQMKTFLQQIELGYSISGQVQKLSAALYNCMNYLVGVTQADTTASAAFAQMQGVCQDYAHILIAMCREMGIYARYVNGFLIGEGATHAWVEFHDKDGWYAIDPTHNRMIDYGYIKIAHGRDATDCSLNKGVFTGITNQQTEIRVIVEEI